MDKKRSDKVLKLVLASLLTVSILINLLYFFGIIEYQTRKKGEIEFIDSPVSRPAEVYRDSVNTE